LLKLFLACFPCRAAELNGGIVLVVGKSDGEGLHGGCWAATEHYPEPGIIFRCYPTPFLLFAVSQGAIEPRRRLEGYVTPRILVSFGFNGVRR
jgi:hypothetical protein